MAAALTLAAAPWTAVAAGTEGTITVRVDLDVDAGGTYDELVDRPQPGIAITVTDAAGDAVTATTDRQGRVVVDPADRGLRGGRYFVVADIPASLDLVPVPQSDFFQPLSTAVDVSTESRTVRLGVTRRPAPESSLPLEARPTPEAVPDLPAAPAARAAGAAASGPRFAVGDQVWYDLDRQGRRDDEPAAAGISVQLLDADGAVLGSTRTDRDGHYVFDGLPRGVYSVRFAGIEKEYRLSPTGVGGAAGDSDPDYTGITPPFELAPDAAGVRRARAFDGVRADYLNPTVDAGVAPLTYAVVSSVWQDLNGDGIADPGEPPAAAKVTLLSTTPYRTVATVHTDSAGRFVFPGLTKGEYQLRFHELGDHRRLTTPQVGSNAAVDSDPEQDTGLSGKFELGAGRPGLVPAADLGGIDADLVDTTHGAGVVGSYTISSRVWDDRNGDGTFTRGESGLRGVRVELLDSSDAVAASTRTTAGGAYRFDVPAGQYRLRFSGYPRGLHFTQPGMGEDRSVDSDVYADARTAPVSVGEDHPVEDGVGAGLTRSTVSTSAGPAPTSVGPVASNLTGPLSAGRLSVLLCVAGVLTAMLGTAAVLSHRLRRR